MKKIIIIILIVLAIGGVGFGIKTTSKKDTGSETTMPTASPSSSTSTQAATGTSVMIQDFAFGPAKLTIKKGDTVTWTNNDDAKHNVAFTSGAFADTEGELFGKGETYSKTFMEAGTYEYHCRPHPYMKATIVVEE